MKKPKKKLAHGVNATGAAGGRAVPPVKLSTAPWDRAQGGKARETSIAPPVGKTAPQRPGEWQQ